MEQWFLKITDFAKELDSSLDSLNWSEKTRVAQKNWIGRKEGCSVRFEREDGNGFLEAFTTRIDTLF